MQRMRPAIEPPRREQALDILRSNRSVSDTAGGGLDFNHRFEPKQTARSGSNNLDVEAAFALGGDDRPFHLVGAERQGAGIARHEDARPRHRRAWSMSADSRALSSAPTTLPSSIAAGAQAHNPRQNTGSKVTRPSAVVSPHSTCSCPRA